MVEKAGEVQVEACELGRPRGGGAAGFYCKPGVLRVSVKLE